MFSGKYFQTQVPINYAKCVVVNPEISFPSKSSLSLYPTIHHSPLSFPIYPIILSSMDKMIREDPTYLVSLAMVPFLNPLSNVKYVCLYQIFPA